MQSKCDECQCNSCTFNRPNGICVGCSECKEHKIITPVSDCSIVKQGPWEGFDVIDMAGNFYCSVPQGHCSVPKYYSISKEEYETFEKWVHIEQALYSILNRG